MAKKTVKLDIGTVFQKQDNGTYYFRYQVNGRRKQISLKTKNQKEAIKRAEEKIPVLKASSMEVIAAHVSHAKSLSAKQKRLKLTSVWEVYSKQPEHVRPKTQKIWNVYQACLNEFLNWLSENYPDVEYMDELCDVDQFGNKLDVSIIHEYADHLRTLKISVDTHNKKISRPATIFRTLDKYLPAPSPWDNKKLKRSASEETHTEHRQPIPAENEKKIFELLKPESSYQPKNKNELQVLVHFLKYTGQRQKDCVYMSWNKIDMKRRRLWVKQEKTGKEVSIPIAQPLYEILLTAKKWKENQYVLPRCVERYSVTAADGTNTGVNTINLQLLKTIKKSGLEPSVKIPGRKKKLTIYGVHSFRHGFASHCAETGVPRPVCASILGADASIIDKYYVHIGEEAQLKAIESLSNEAPKTDREKIQDVLNYINCLEVETEELLKVKELLS